MSRLSRTLTILAAITFSGCQQQQAVRAPVSQLDQQVSADFVVPPKELLADVAAALQAAPISLTVEQQTRDSITTGWKRFVGDFHIARHWQERTRYRIIVIPDTEEPMSRSRLQVDEETQQRAASQQDFEAASYLHRPERAADLLRQLKEKLPSHSTARAAESSPQAPSSPQAAVAVNARDITWHKMLPDLGDDSPETVTILTGGRATPLMIKAHKAIHLPLHASPTATVFTVITGHLRMKVGGAEHDLAPAGYIFIPADAPHEAWLSDDTTLSIVADGRWDVKWLNGAPTRADVGR